jgi:3'-phosphoadenosine 5'-phosphosulfate sulfotransferase (PAPS reductase)/FAD synthetase
MMPKAPTDTRLLDRMQTYDGLPPEGRALVGDYGLNAALAAYNGCGDWSRARRDLQQARGAVPRARVRRTREPEVEDPFRLAGPAVISVSGGRTSGYLLWRLLNANGGRLPPDVVACFANTGKEREETYRFVRNMAEAWDVPIRWLEWRLGQPGYAEVDFASAARAGQPFDALIEHRGFLPNPRMRFCSRDLKVEPINHFCRDRGWDYWTNVIGLRHDEGARLLRKYAENAQGTHRWTSRMPLDKGRVVKAEVMDFWSGQAFDLGLRSYEGNCDLCFMKGSGTLAAIIRETPGCASWWIDAEARTGRRFERDRSYAAIADAVAVQPSLFELEDADHEYDAECGISCAA